jgi:nicotinate-nucleotide adenylyltransferase
MRVGIFGGTFDPIHAGHLVLAEQCREQCQLDEVWFVPAAVPPHKLDAVISSAKARCEMIEFAIAGNPQFKLSRIELGREGTSYTVTTLEQLHAEEPARELFLLVGADSIRDLPTWRQPRRILELATVVAVNRGRDVLSPVETEKHLTDQLGHAAAARVQFIQMPGICISATEIRQRVASGRSIRYLAPRAVEMYIREQKLYS